MAEERSEGATTEGPSVTSTVDANERLPRLGDAASDRYVGGGAGGLELATSLGDKLGKRNRAQVTLIEGADAFLRGRTALDHEAEIRALRNCYASLSHREREVMALVVSGLLNKQVGGKLGISEIR